MSRNIALSDSTAEAIGQDLDLKPHVVRRTLEALKRRSLPLVRQQVTEVQVPTGYGQHDRNR